MVLGQIRIILWNRLACLLKRFRFSGKWEGSESESLKTPILPFQSCGTKTWNVSNRFTYETFWFFPFGTAPSNSSLNLKRFTLPNGALISGIIWNKTKMICLLNLKRGLNQQHNISLNLKRFTSIPTMWHAECISWNALVEKILFLGGNSY
jgi:hypothetical protein